jgi:hypothetical protein
MVILNELGEEDFQLLTAKADHPGDIKTIQAQTLL